MNTKKKAEDVVPQQHKALQVKAESRKTPQIKLKVKTKSKPSQNQVKTKSKPSQNKQNK